MLKQLYIAHNHKVLNTHGHLILTQRPITCCPETDYSYKLIQCAQTMNAPSLQSLGNCHVLLLEVEITQWKMVHSPVHACNKHTSNYNLGLINQNTQHKFKIHKYFYYIIIYMYHSVWED